MTDVTSVSLLYRVRDANDSASWNEFASLYGKMIRGWLRAQCIHANDADDLVQDVMTFVHREISQFDHNGRIGAFRNWLRQVTVNRMRSFWRDRSRSLRDGPDIGRLADQLADDRSGVSRVWRDEYDRYVIDHILSLAERQFRPQTIAAFRQIVLEERPASDVAEELGISVGAVRVAQSRVLTALRRLGEGLID